MLVHQEEDSGREPEDQHDYPGDVGRVVLVASPVRRSGGGARGARGHAQEVRQRLETKDSGGGGA